MIAKKTTKQTRTPRANPDPVDVLHTYSVELMDGSKEIIQAHFCNGGLDGSGHLAFVLVNMTGQQSVTNVFNVHIWRRVTDITSD